MTIDNYLEKVISSGKWTKIVDGNLPDEGKVVNLLYLNEEGSPCFCTAYIIKDKWRKHNYSVEEDYIVDCIAWKNIN